MKAADLEYMVAYQIGALQAMASYAGLKVTHLKPHGALNNMAADDAATLRNGFRLLSRPVARSPNVGAASLARSIFMR